MIVVGTGKSSENIIYVAAAAVVEALRRERKERMKLCLPPVLVEKLVWVAVISFVL
jgi:hypothetical protein